MGKVIAVLLGLLAIFGIFFGVVEIWQDSGSVFRRWFIYHFWIAWLWPGGWNLFHASGWGLLLIAVILIVAAVFLYYLLEARRVVAVTVTVVMVLGALGALVNAGIAAYMFTRESGEYFLQNSEYVVKDLKKIPASLSAVAQGHSSDNCAITNDTSYYTCINQGVLVQDWKPRVSSLAAAKTKFNDASGTVPNTSIMDDSITYVNDEWTAIRNGKRTRAIDSVIVSDGVGPLKVCSFTKEYSVGQAFGGNGHGNNLRNTLAKRYGNLFLNEDDMWGYCSEGKPVIVAPMTKQVNYGHRTLYVAAGVLVIKGTTQDTPDIEYKPVVKAGEFPGPVYPKSLVVKQRNALAYGPGRWESLMQGFGYSPTATRTGAGNGSDFLLTDAKTGRMFWVNPMSVANTNGSTLTVAYSLIPADEVTSGNLNHQKVYVFDLGDSEIVNTTEMTNAVQNKLSTEYSGFKINGGELIEFLPITNNTWQVYGESGGRVWLRVIVPTNAYSKATVERLDGTKWVASEGEATTNDPSGSEPEPSPTQSPTTKASTGSCQPDVKGMPTEQLKRCFDEVNDEVKRRLR